MRVFIDTSSLFKKYMDESGSSDFEELLAKASEIAVSPITWMEVNAALARCVRGRLLSAEQAGQLRVEAKRDFTYFLKVIWNEHLEDKTVEMIQKCELKTFDAMQLASGILSEAELFVTSDKKLYQEAKKMVHHIRFV